MAREETRAGRRSKLRVEDGNDEYTWRLGVAEAPRAIGGAKKRISCGSSLLSLSPRKAVGAGEDRAQQGFWSRDTATRKKRNKFGGERAGQEGRLARGAEDGRWEVADVRMAEVR